jgi:hypothetical protein
MRRDPKRERELADASRLLRAWKNFHRDEKAAVLSGPHTATLAELFRMFSSIACVKPAQLIGFIGAIDWGAIDANTRLVTLHELNNAITRYREKRGLTPIDDPLEGENVFRTARKIITEFPAPSQEGPTPRGPDPRADYEGRVK